MASQNASSTRVLRVLHFSLGNYETCVWQQDFTKDSVVSCFPFCKPSPILVRDSCNAPVCVEITTKLCIKVFLKILNLLCVVYAAKNGIIGQKTILFCACCMCNPELLNKLQCIVANVHFPDYIIEWKWS